ncbi:hypothetical protein KOI35_31605 [Actinoplanes bogorensis]|uniref:Lipoprotein n=1 Tax=Paractinoplanes bogorensis TaxID=1610840 RepID=A0ABS5YXB3_9ACTN|nr:hypothetical protein [Actinoplanes bogorensis]MBU2668066.1 hypothetical protein [Actinoplanes bogorensis]
MTRKAMSTVLLIGLLTAGCSGGGGGSPTTPESSAPGRQQLLALGQEWVQCLRDHGLTRMPDAQLSQDGYLQFVPDRSYNWKDDLVKRRSIIEACQSIEDRYPPNAFRPKDQPSAGDLRKLAEFATCIRAHGLPAFPDPNQAGAFDLAGTPLAQGVPGDRWDQANDACKGIWSGEVRMLGIAGGKK